MIFDYLEEAALYRGLPSLYRGLCLAQEFMGNPAFQEYASEDGRIRLTRLTIHTKPEEQCRYEAHRRYIDVHCVLKGTETIFVGRTTGLSPLGGFDAQKDIGFFQGDAQAVCHVGQGQFLVCFPQDAHKVCVCGRAPESVDKIIVKILAERP